DTLDPSYPYGEGIALQLRSAVSHLNEVWAVETAGVILHELAGELGWEFVRDAARWVYDESRHMLMGKRRLAAWGLDPAGIPLGEDEEGWPAILARCEQLVRARVARGTAEEAAEIRQIAEALVAEATRRAG